MLYCLLVLFFLLFSSAMIREQNQGLAHELGGYLFQPRINQTSLDLSATMKSLQLRMPEMIAERNKDLETKKREAEEVRER
jgi:Skp family chaperone for outer membrane proteins